MWINRTTVLLTELPDKGDGIEGKVEHDPEDGTPFYLEGVENGWYTAKDLRDLKKFITALEKARKEAVA